MPLTVAGAQEKDKQNDKAKWKQARGEHGKDVRTCILKRLSSKQDILCQGCSSQKKPIIDSEPDSDHCRRSHNSKQRLKLQSSTRQVCFWLGTPNSVCPAACKEHDARNQKIQHWAGSYRNNNSNRSNEE